MAINYETLRASEDNLFSQFKKYIEHIHEMWTFFNQTIESRKINNKVMDQIYEYEEKANLFEGEIMDECIWTISKDQPIASHLRFIIAILNSSNNLERMADHIVSGTRYFLYHQDADKEILDLLSEVSKISLKTSISMLSVIEKQKQTEIYESALALQKTYRAEYQNVMVCLSQILKTKTVEEIANLLSGAMIIFKHMERNVDHASNIIENFIYIKQHDFFVKKRSKQAIDIKERKKPIINTKKPTIKTKKSKSKKHQKVKNSI